MMEHPVDGAGSLCAARIWAWMEMGLAERKKLGLASFCRPAKQNVKP